MYFYTKYCLCFGLVLDIIKLVVNFIVALFSVQLQLQESILNLLYGRNGVE